VPKLKSPVFRSSLGKLPKLENKTGNKSKEYGNI